MSLNTVLVGFHLECESGHTQPAVLANFNLHLQPTHEGHADGVGKASVAVVRATGLGTRARGARAWG